MTPVEAVGECAHSRKSARLYLRPSMQAWLTCDDCHEERLQFLPRATADARATPGASSYESLALVHYGL